MLFLLPPAPSRLRSLEGVLLGNLHPERYLFYGIDFFVNKGLSVAHNVVTSSRMICMLGEFFRRFVVGCGAYAGDLEWILPVWNQLLHCDAIVVFSDRIIFPLIYLRMTRLLPRCPVVYITVGLPEKMDSFRSMGVKRRVLTEFDRLDRIVTLSVVEADCLVTRHGFGGNVNFVPAGVDVRYFRPMDTVPTVDVLSIGADPFRDFRVLFDAARLLSDKTFLVVTSRTHADIFGDIPTNVRVLIEVPMSEIKGLLTSCRVVALPVRENTYSGGTTVMLQAMAMGKTVVANRIGANVSGYGFEHGKNCIFVSPQDGQTLATTLADLLEDPARRDAIGHAARRHVERELTLDRFHGRLFDMVMEMNAKTWASA